MRLTLLSLIALALSAQPPADEPALRYVAIVARHGVRAPSWSPEQLARYSSAPWPQWTVAPSELTPHGALLLRQLGAYLRLDLSSRHLFAPEGCADANAVTLWADTDQRTLASARALADGLLPGCEIPVGSAPEGSEDRLFNPLAAGAVKADRRLALASVLGRIGPDPSELLALHRPALDELSRILSGGAPTPRSLFDEPHAIVSGKGDNLVDVTGPLRTASTLTENLLLEYTDGRSGSSLGWGRLDAASLRRVMSLHTAYADLARRTPYLARARGSNLLHHLLLSLEQALSSKPVPGALGNPSTRLLYLSGHDTNLSNLSGMLGLNWILPGYAPDDTPPGGALVFELLVPTQGPARVRLSYLVQSLEQMHAATPLSLEKPPLQAPLFLDGCSSSGPGFECPWPSFRQTLLKALDPAFVLP